MKKLMVTFLALFYCISGHSAEPDYMELMGAISNSELPKIKHLLNDPERRTKIAFQEQTRSGNTPLTLAVFKGNLSMVRIILEHASDSDSQKMRDGSTPLMIAAGKGDIAIVKFLLFKGADPSLKRKSDQVTPFFLASQEGHQEVIEEFFKSNHFNYKTEIQTAISKGRHDLAHDLLEIHSQDSRFKKYENPPESYPLNSALHSMATLFDSVCSICTEAAGTTSGMSRVDGKEKRGVAQVTQCGHCFCKACLDKHFTVRNARDLTLNCPNCRASLSKKKILLVRLEGEKAAENQPKIPVPGHDEPALTQPIRVMENDPRITRNFAALGDMYQVGNVIWSGMLKGRNIFFMKANWYMNQLDAAEYCDYVDQYARLPTLEEYDDLASAMGKGKPEGYNSHLLPDMDYFFWSMSSGFFFSGSSGETQYSPRENDFAVRCVMPI